MSSIFDTLHGKIDPTNEIHKLAQLFEEDIIVGRYGYDRISLEEFINDNCFLDWKGRRCFLSLEELKVACGLAKIREETSLDESKTTLYLEYLVNMIHLFECKYTYYYNNGYIDRDRYLAMRENIDQLLSWLNLMEYEIPRKDYVEYRLIPAKAEICEAIKVIDNPNIKCDILKYNHISIRNDLVAKQKILSNLYKDFESKKGRLKQGGCNIGHDLGFLFNNLGIRHNDQKTKPAIKTMSDTEKLEWCDRCFQLYVTTILIDEYLTEHKTEIERLKKKDEDEMQN